MRKYPIITNFKFQMSNKKNWILDIPARRQTGQAMVMLVFFTLIAITITTSAIVIIATNATSESKLQQGFSTLDAAEAGAENSMLRFLRDPSYTGETMNVGSSSVVIQASLNGTTYISTSTATLNSDVRKIQVTAVYNNSVLSISSWKEIF